MGQIKAEKNVGGIEGLCVIEPAVNGDARGCFMESYNEKNMKETGTEWPELKGEYKGSTSAEGYTLEDDTVLNLGDKDQNWLGLKDTFKY